MTFINERYTALQDIFRNKRLPLVIVDLDVSITNVTCAAQKVHARGKTIRLGRKSIRCERLMKHTLDHNGIRQGLLTYATEETQFSANKAKDMMTLSAPVRASSYLISTYPFASHR